MYIREKPMRVAKWGRSLAVRLPTSVVEALRLKEGDEVEIHVTDGRSFRVAKPASSRQLLSRLRKYRGRLPASFKFGRMEANEQ
jgi:antitoxin MazE